MRYQIGILAGFAFGALTVSAHTESLMAIQSKGTDVPRSGASGRYGYTPVAENNGVGGMGGSGWSNGQSQYGVGGMGGGWGTWCQFTSGPMAGQKKNFAPQQGPLGGTCNEGINFGRIVGE